MEIRFEIYDPGTEDKIRLDERGGDSPLIPSGAAQNVSALEGGRGYLRLMKHEARLYSAPSGHRHPCTACTRVPWE